MYSSHLGAIFLCDHQKGLLRIFALKNISIQKQFTLGRDERLKSRKAIDQLFKTGKSFSHFPFRIIYQLEDGEPSLQSGFTVSSKTFKQAVNRNRIKRLMREVYRLQKNELKQTVTDKRCRLAVFFIYTGNGLPEFDDLKEKMESALARLIKIVNEKSPADN